MSDATSRKPVLWIVLVVLAVAVAIGIAYLGPKFIAGGEGASIRANPDSQVDITAADLQKSVQTVTLSGPVSPEMFDEIKDSLIGSFCQLNREVWNNQYVAARYLHSDAEGNAYSRVIPASECPPPQEGERPIIPSADDMPAVPPQSESSVNNAMPAEDQAIVEPAVEENTSSDNTIVEDDVTPAPADDTPAQDTAE